MIVDAVDRFQDEKLTACGSLFGESGLSDLDFEGWAFCDELEDTAEATVLSME
jgi:hypothetical protein